MITQLNCSMILSRSRAWAGLEDMNEKILSVLEAKGVTGIEHLQGLSLSDVEVMLHEETPEIVEAVQGIIDINADAIDAYVAAPET